MKKNNSFKSSLAAGALALAVTTTALPAHTAYGQSSTDLQAQIATLLGQIQQLQTQLGGQTTVKTPSINLTRNLNIGMSGTDVIELQRFLNSDPDTVVATFGAGSIGNETMYFGPATRAAVIKYQNKYRNEILTPLGLSQGTGFVGASTRTHLNARTSTPPTTPTNPTTPDKPSTPGSVLQGEGELDKLEIDQADDTRISEASSDAPIAKIIAEARDGDIEISRIDVSLVAHSSNTERDPWDVFENISLWVDGKKVAEQRTSSRSDFQNRTSGTLRFSGLKLVLEEDEEHEITIAASVRNNTDGAGSSAKWSVKMDSIRFKEANGVITTDTTTGDLGKSVNFEIVERGDDEELKFSVSDKDPVERTIVVDTKRRTNNVTLLGYTMEALGNDIELDKLYVNIETGTASFNDVVSDVRLKIGNQTFNDDSIVTTGNYSATSTLVSFNINNKIEIDEDKKVNVELIVDLKPRTNYQNGETIRAQVTSVERDMTRAEGADDIKTFSGSIVGKVQTLITEGIYTPANSVKFKTETLGSNSTIGVFTIEFDVTAVEKDFYITDTTSTSGATTTGGVKYKVDTTAGTPTSVSGVLSSTAKENTSGVFTVRQGQTETFTLIVTIDAGSAGNHRVLLESIQFASNTDGVTGGSTLQLTPVNDFRTPYKFINN